MDITADGIMSNAFVLCKRDDKREYPAICRRFAAAGFSVMPRPFCYDTPECLIPASKEAKCSINHYFIVKAAMALGLPYVMVLEGDAYPMNGCRREIDLMLATHTIPDDADVVSFGNLSFIHNLPGCLPGASPDFPYGSMGKRVWGSQAVLYMGRGYGRYLSAIEKISDCKKCYADHWYAMDIKMYHTYRSFFIQVGLDGKIQHKPWLWDTDSLSDFPGIVSGDYILGKYEKYRK